MYLYAYVRDVRSILIVREYNNSTRTMSTLSSIENIEDCTAYAIGFLCYPSVGFMSTQGIQTYPLHGLGVRRFVQLAS